MINFLDGRSQLELRTMCNGVPDGANHEAGGNDEVKNQRDEYEEAIKDSLEVDEYHENERRVFEERDQEELRRWVEEHDQHWGPEEIVQENKYVEEKDDEEDEEEEIFFGPEGGPMSPFGRCKACGHAFSWTGVCRCGFDSP